MTDCQGSFGCGPHDSFCGEIAKVRLYCFLFSGHELDNVYDANQENLR